MSSLQKLDKLKSEHRDNLKHLINCFTLNVEKNDFTMVRETLHIISILCSNFDDLRTYIRKLDGLTRIIEFFTNLNINSNTSNEFLEVTFRLFTTLCDGNVCNQKICATLEMFQISKQIISIKSIENEKLFKTVIVCLISLVFENGDGQLYIRQSGLLKCVLNIYRSIGISICDGSNISNSTDIWVLLNTLIQFSVYNPLNVENQNACSEIYVDCIELLGRGNNSIVIKTLLTFFTFTCTSNDHNQTSLLTSNALNAIESVAKQTLSTSLDVNLTVLLNLLTNCANRAQRVKLILDSKLLNIFTKTLSNWKTHYPIDVNSIIYLIIHCFKFVKDGQLEYRIRTKALLRLLLIATKATTELPSNTNNNLLIKKNFLYLIKIIKHILLLRSLGQQTPQRRSLTTSVRKRRVFSLRPRSLIVKHYGNLTPLTDERQVINQHMTSTPTPQPLSSTSNKNTSHSSSGIYTELSDTESEISISDYNQNRPPSTASALTAEEISYLVEGVLKYGRNWKYIFSSYNFQTITNEVDLQTSYQLLIKYKPELFHYNSY